jgi:hypothetical protein
MDIRQLSVGVSSNDIHPSINNGLFRESAHLCKKVTVRTVSEALKDDTGFSNEAGKPRETLTVAPCTKAR